MSHDENMQGEQGNRAVDAAETEVTLGKGIDLGTANIAAAVQNADGGITVNVNYYVPIGGEPILFTHNETKSPGWWK